MNFHLPKFFFHCFSLCVLIFLILPIIIVIPMSFSSASSLQFPPPGFSMQWYFRFFGSPEWMDAMKNSFIISFVASLNAVILGGLASYGLSLSKFRGRSILLAKFISPMIFPTIITAVALYFWFSQLGLLGTYAGLILAHTIVVVPFVILIVFPAIDSFDRRLELAARSLGASWLTTIFRVFLPNIMPSILGAWFFAFMMSFDELLVTIFISGRYFTLPKKIYNELILQINPVITAISTILIVFTALIMLLIALLITREENEDKGIGGFIRIEK